MPKIYLIRHARPAAGWGEEADPGLDATGQQQAEAAAQTLAQTLDRMPIYTSPLRRCRETARPLERLWQRPAEVFQPVAELPSPPLDLRARQQWLQQIMRGTWRELNDLAPAGSPDYLGWRQTLLDSLARLPQDSVVFSHFIAINAAVAAAHSREDVVCFRPDHASITCVEAGNGSLRLIELGRQADTPVLGRT
ncbi:MAG TPA: phosphoglycerate mutase family protein [Burkholderiales bacterium]|nr:phosphoglycerate mutase family protein [Burkholderiales bacterium]